MANVPNAVEILPKITTACIGCTSVTDRQTDRQMDGRQQFMFAKNEVSGEAKQTMYIAPKSTNESRAHNAHSLHGTPF